MVAARCPFVAIDCLDTTESRCPDESPRRGRVARREHVQSEQITAARITALTQASADPTWHTAFATLRARPHLRILGNCGITIAAAGSLRPAIREYGLGCARMDNSAEKPGVFTWLIAHLRFRTCAAIRNDISARRFSALRQSDCETDAGQPVVLEAERRGC